MGQSKTLHEKVALALVRSRIGNLMGLDYSVTLGRLHAEFQTEEELKEFMQEMEVLGKELFPFLTEDELNYLKIDEKLHG